jgi:heme A synthase
VVAPETAVPGISTVVLGVPVIEAVTAGVNLAVSVKAVVLAAVRQMLTREEYGARKPIDERGLRGRRGLHEARP